MDYMCAHGKRVCLHFLLPEGNMLCNQWQHCRIPACMSSNPWNAYCILHWPRTPSLASANFRSAAAPCPLGKFRLPLLHARFGRSSVCCMANKGWLLWALHCCTMPHRDGRAVHWKVFASFLAYSKFWYIQLVHAQLFFTIPVFRFLKIGYKENFASVNF